jgi:hypothetical protein
VGKFVEAEVYPERHQSREGARRSLLDPYKGYILQRWQQGCRNSVQLYDEITTRGFKGSAPLLRKFLAALRKKHQEAGSASVLTLDACTQAIEIPASLPPKPRITSRMSATRASWLFVSQAGKLNAAFLIGATIEGGERSKGAEPCPSMYKHEQRRMNRKNVRCVNWPEAITHLPIGSSTPTW